MEKICFCLDLQIINDKISAITVLTCTHMYVSYEIENQWKQYIYTLHIHINLNKACIWNAGIYFPCTVGRSEQ